MEFISLSVIVVPVVIAVVVFLGFESKRRWITANPNEWLLLIQNGELVTAGVGVSVFRGINQTVVKFPSLLNKVNFMAQQVSKEMQGVELKGFLVWAVHRTEDGPIRAYRSIKDLEVVNQTSEVTQNIQAMAESIVRHQIANLTIEEVLTKRSLVRDRIRSEMQEILTGWGIWLETVEITEVRILSSSLFNDLQTPFRQETHRNAAGIRMETEEKIQQAEIEKNFNVERNRIGKAAAKEIFRSQQKLASQKEEFELLEETEKFKQAKMKMENATQIFKLKCEEEKNEERQALNLKQLQHELEKEKMRADQKLDIMKEMLTAEAQLLTPANVQKMVLGTVENVFTKMRVDSVKFVNMNMGDGADGGGGGSGNGLESAVTRMMMGLQEATKGISGQ